MLITFGEAKEALKKYIGKAGKCPTDEGADLFVKEVIQELLFRGTAGSLRKWEFITQNGTFTAPSDLELPIKMRVGAEVGNVMDKFYEFYDQNTLADCSPCEGGLVEEINQYYTAYDIPCGGARILAVPLCKEDCDANFVIQGLDKEGKQVHMPHKGEQVHGERLSISKEAPKFTAQTFTRITGIEKTLTKNYVRLYYHIPETGERGFLGEYKPGDTHPSFRRFRVVGMSCEKCFKVTILGRIRFCDKYYDNDIIPISNLRALKLMAQQLQAEDNDDIQTASYKNQRIEQSLTNENHYKRTAQAPVDFLHALSPGALKNLI